MRYQLDALVHEYESIENELADEAVYTDPKRLRDTMRRKKTLEEVVTLYRQYLAANQTIVESKELLESESDAEMLSMVKEELSAAEEAFARIESELTLALLPKNPNDDKDIILEVRAGAGGEEAALFAAELADSYFIFAKELGFSVEIIDRSDSENGGAKEIIARIGGTGAYSKFKYEAGTHRVQRIPATESKGRIHTSAVTVAVLPEAEEVDVQIRDEDLDITTARASGAGGQHVNKTNSAIRIVHKPTGVVVECQDQRSQLQNKTKALQVLRSRIYALEQEKQDQAIASVRAAQVGSGDRSEKIRTYNFPQDRVTDHRIGENFSGVPMIMAGRLWPIVEHLATAEQQAKLESISAGQL